MPKKIYFGDLLVQNTRTKEKRTITRQVFTENQNLSERTLRAFALSNLPRKERDTYIIIRCIYETAKHIGYTAY